MARRTRRTLIMGGILGYLAALAAGLVMHQWELAGRRTVPGYLVVWDMFCGWSGFERRVEYLAVGESGRFYDAGTVPGAGVTPHGPVGRRHFDHANDFAGAAVASVLQRTEHEPIVAVHVVERSWPKAGGGRRHDWVAEFFDPQGDASQRRGLWHVVESAKSYEPPARSAATPVIMQASGQSRGRGLQGAATAPY